MARRRRISAVKPNAQEFAEAAEAPPRRRARVPRVPDGRPKRGRRPDSRDIRPALRALAPVRPARRSARTWLCQLARSTALDHFRSEERRRRREGRYALECPEAQEPSFGEGLSPELEAGLARLSAAEREVLALRVVLDLDGESAARVLGISQTACSTRLSRALQKLEQEVSAGVAA